MVDAFLRLPVVMARTGLSRSSLYLAMSRDEFPRAVRISRHAVAWLERDVQQWIEKRVHQERHPEDADNAHVA